MGDTDSLPAIGFIQNLDEDIRRRLAAAGEFHDLPEGAYFVTQGESRHDLAVILSGTLTVMAHAHGSSVKLAELGPGETVGEMNVIDPRNASADVVVKRPARLWTISPQRFEEFVESDCRAGYALMKVLATELCRRLRKTSDSMLKQVEETRASALDHDY